MSRAGLVVYTSHGVPALRAVLRGLRETVDRPAGIVVFADDASDVVATYLVRQYLRGRIDALQLESGDRHGMHCGIDRAFHMVDGDFLVRVDDTLEFQPGWLDRSIAALEADPAIGCLSLLPPDDYHRGRGRPRTVHVEPVTVDHLDMRCFVTRRDLVQRHECQLLGERAGECAFQRYLRERGSHAGLSARRGDGTLRGRRALSTGRLRPRGRPAGAPGRLRRHAAPGTGLRPR